MIPIRHDQLPPVTQTQELIASWGNSIDCISSSIDEMMTQRAPSTNDNGPEASVRAPSISEVPTDKTREKHDNTGSSGAATYVGHGVASVVEPDFCDKLLDQLALRFECGLMVAYCEGATAKIVAKSERSRSLGEVKPKDVLRLIREADLTDRSLSDLHLVSVVPSAIATEIAASTGCSVVTIPLRNYKLYGRFCIVAFCSSEKASDGWFDEFSAACQACAAECEAWKICQKGLAWEKAIALLRSGRNRTVVTLIAAIILTILLVPVPYRPTRECTLDAAEKHYVSAVQQGRLKEVFVRPGDRVLTGQLLARLDDDQLQRDLASAVAQREAANKKREVALVSRVGGDLRIAQLEQQQAELKIASLEAKLEQLEIRSPSDGIIIQGDWFGAEGKPVNFGDNLFEISSMQEMVARIELMPRDIAEVHPGTRVLLRSSALFGERLQGNITRIEPSATVKDEQCVFVADVKLDPHSAELRPGLKAQAKLVVEPRSLLRQWFQQPMEWLKNWAVW